MHASEARRRNITLKPIRSYIHICCVHSYLWIHRKLLPWFVTMTVRRTLMMLPMAVLDVNLTFLYADLLEDGCESLYFGIDIDCQLTV